MPNYWITGADGFIGRHLGHLLVGQGAHVCGLGFQDGGLTGGVSYADWAGGGIDRDLLEGLAARQPQPDVIFHLAGGSSVGASLADPFGDFRNTVGSIATVLEWMRVATPRARLVMISSAAVYGSGHGGAIAEDAATHPYSPYGAHKLVAEMLCRSAAENFGTDFVVVRPFSIFGAGLRKQLLWDVCTRLAAGPASLDMGGTGKELRDWLHVSDLAAILARVAARDVAAGSILNAGTGYAVPVRTIVGWLVEAFGMGGLTVRFSGQSRPGDPERLVADVARLGALGIAPPADPRAMVEAFVAWFRAL